MHGSEEFLVVMTLIAGVITALLVLPVTLVILVSKLTRRQEESTELMSLHLKSVRSPLHLPPAIRRVANPAQCLHRASLKTAALAAVLPWWN